MTRRGITRFENNIPGGRGLLSLSLSFSPATMHDRASGDARMHRQQAPEDSRDGLRQCRHECIYASRLNKIKETPARESTRTSGAASSLWGEEGEGDLKTQLETAAEFPPRILPGLRTLCPLNLSLAQTLSRTFAPSRSRPFAKPYSVSFTCTKNRPLISYSILKYFVNSKFLS